MNLHNIIAVGVEINSTPTAIMLCIHSMHPRVSVVVAVFKSEPAIYINRTRRQKNKVA